MCQVLFDIIEDGNVSIDHVQNDIVCKFDRHPSEPSKPVPPTGDPNGAPDPPTPEPDKTFLDFAKRYRYELFAIAILLVVLLVILTQF
jgi:hypothetical protein